MVQNETILGTIDTLVHVIILVTVNQVPAGLGDTG
jgi:hypothetical protein